MPLFQHKRRKGAPAYDPKTMTPAVRKSICTGEMTAGLVDRATGHFTDLMRLEDQAALEAFCQSLGASAEDVKIIY